ncbi:MAG: cytochrome c maturation protein CcmE [Desulfohalobiaceae bacterium]|nr:cytochrome c maturation protein CcmE [Desulfohalobiaceae bacterium]MCF8085380.1 cytochrome c maturation protein CcmE [Desulfohalobiaceae bacterium]
MRSKKNQKTVYIAALGLLCLGLGYLVLSGIQQSNMYFLNVSEALAKTPQEVQKARVFGTIAPDGLPDASGDDEAVLRLADKENPQQTLRVKYSGVLPDNLKPGTEVIVEGSMGDSGNVFSAHTLLTQCPSKYESES